MFLFYFYNFIFRPQSNINTEPSNKSSTPTKSYLWQIERKNKIFPKQLLDVSCKTKKFTWKNKIINQFE
ncbi:hypothetical protein BpHYR1_022028 [Brachionus plicatilis]|uniref:Uncharacterized protein n=1 Tax=Brachionus plicatilis TaxID=10195 RepID=A0A3M7SX35_BRAPC|nr:hypothetical protein BpHYR1_022028 [Brachionus plicatilis]